MTTEVALNLSKKYESVRLYLHWPNVPTLTLHIYLEAWTHAFDILSHK